MILLVFLLCVPAVLFVWRLCAVAGAADDQMEAMLRKMRQEKQDGSQALDDDPSAEGDVHEG